MADWTDLDTGDNYITLLAAINDRDLDSARAFETLPTNPKDKMFRFNRSTLKFEQYNAGGAVWEEKLISIAGGGTGANTASGARSNLGLGSLAVQNVDNATINAGSSVDPSTLSGTVPTAKLGSGSATSSTFLRGDQTWAVPSGIPAGAILPYGGTSAPTGYLMCDGSAVDRTTYAGLFAVIGIAYGAGNGSSTFNLPDLRQRFPLGKATAGTGSTLGGVGGSIDHTHDYNTVIAHTHRLQLEHGGGGGSNWGVGDGYVNSVATLSGYADTPIESTGSASGTTDADNPPYQVVNFIIKT